VSARAESVPRSPIAVEALSWLAVPAGLALLLSRLTLVPGASSTVPALALTFAALAATSLAAPRTPADETAALATWPVVVVGACAVAIAAFASTLPGPALPSRPGTTVLVLAVAAAVAEEAFFRRLLYGRLLRWGAAAAVAGSAVVFGLVHLPLHGTAALPVDLGAGLVLSWQRWASGGWAAPAATHALANVVAVLR
jgi:membrane protease YdiL (CAAX protease family)